MNGDNLTWIVIWVLRHKEVGTCLQFSRKSGMKSYRVSKTISPNAEVWIKIESLSPAEIMLIVSRSNLARSKLRSFTRFSLLLLFVYCACVQPMFCQLRLITRLCLLLNSLFFLFTFFVVCILYDLNFQIIFLDFCGVLLFFLLSILFLFFSLSPQFLAETGLQFLA